MSTENTPVHCLPNTAPNQVRWEWSARIHFKTHELGSSFTVCVFLGAVPEDPQEWLISRNLVGRHSAYVGGIDGNRFVNPVLGGRHAYGGERTDIDEGFVQLNRGIFEHSGFASLEPETVVPYLTKELKWRVQKSDSTPAELESLELVVFATALTYPPGEIFPVPEKSRRFNGITYGRPGGSRDP
ncbi:hypothetical protein B0H34DRAFT_691940 [Crassisporium funariophilum]|nr:hypothetical protein B0H34DRAFT_691940 [Crassisporium funariophilum]